MKAIFAVLGIGLIVTLSSCEGNTNREGTVENNSSYTIELNVSSNFSKVSSYSIQPGSSRTIYTNDLRGGQTEAGKTEDYFEHILLTNPKDSTVQDLQDNVGWNVRSEQVKKIPSMYEHEFTLSVTDDIF